MLDACNYRPFLTKTAHTAVQFVCDSWPTCY